MDAEATPKQVSRVTIEYTDGTRVNLEQYAAVGFGGGIWRTVMLSPAGVSAKIKMNNKLVELSNHLVKAITDAQTGNG
jgi:hypothetical protein